MRQKIAAVIVAATVAAVGIACSDKQDDSKTEPRVLTFVGEGPVDEDDLRVVDKGGSFIASFTCTAPEESRIIDGAMLAYALPDPSKSGSFLESTAKLDFDLQEGEVTEIPDGAGVVGAVNCAGVKDGSISGKVTGFPWVLTLTEVTD